MPCRASRTHYKENAAVCPGGGKSLRVGHIFPHGLPAGWAGGLVLPGGKYPSRHDISKLAASGGVGSRH